MRIHFIVHESFESPGAIKAWAENNNLNISYTHLYKGEKLPASVNDFDCLVIMGGPQSPATTKQEYPHFDAPKEIAFIKEAILSEKYVLGVCLGAQLIGEALGAKFDHSPHREIGLFDVELTDEGKEDPIFSQFPSTFSVGHWHGDMPGLTPESQVLAYSKGCPRQVIRYTPKVYGFQCHFEFTPEAIEGMITHCNDELEEYKALPYIQSAEVLRKNDYTPVNQKLFLFLDAMKSDFESSKA